MPHDMPLDLLRTNSEAMANRLKILAHRLIAIDHLRKGFGGLVVAF